MAYSSSSLSLTENSGDFVVHRRHVTNSKTFIWGKRTR